MEIIINGQQAVLKKGTSFDFIAENSLFTGSDSYTLTITFPLRGCAENVAIFGHIHRAEVEAKKVVFGCDIRDGTFFKSGTITVTELSDVEVKTQFLEGRSEQNFDETFDEIYLNELDLGYPSERTAVSGTCPGMMRPWPENFWLPLPWVNNSTGNIQNQMFWNYDTKEYRWRHEAYPSMGVQTLSFQPYLLYILRRITLQIGYEGDFSALEDSDLAYLLICNTLPAAWDATNFALALPHWTLTEFFEELEKFLFGSFAINHKAKTIVFRFADTLAEEAGEVMLERVVDSYTAQVTQEDKSEYLGGQTLAYEDNGALMWAYDSCDWYVRQCGKDAKVYDTLDDLLKVAKGLQISGVTTYNLGNGTATRLLRGYTADSLGHELFYVRNLHIYFVMYCYKALLYQETGGHKWYMYYNRLYPINAAGERYAGEDAEKVEMKCVPAWIEDTGDANGRMLYLTCGDMGSNESWVLTEDGSSSSSSSSSDSTARKFVSADGESTIDYDAGDLSQGRASRRIEKGEQDETDAYFDQIYFGFWDGKQRWWPAEPHPIVDSVEVTDNFEAITAPYSLRLKEGLLDVRRDALRMIDGKKKYEFSFLSDTMPNPRAVFYIRGGRYICEKITATFTENGMSQLLKGTFYRVLSDD